MSVVKAEQKESDFQVMVQYRKMRNLITDLVLQCFFYNMPLFSDEKLKSELIKKHIKHDGQEPDVESDKFKTEFYVTREKYLMISNSKKAFISFEQNVVMSYLRDIGSSLIGANSIYAEYVCECEERRLLQDNAIEDCYRLRNELQYVSEMFKLDKEKLLGYDDCIEELISLIKGWRKSDNKHFKKAIQNELEQSLITDITDDKYTQMLLLDCTQTILKSIYNDENIDSDFEKIKSDVISDYKKIVETYKLATDVNQENLIETIKNKYAKFTKKKNKNKNKYNKQ